jgi:hypothetical protein
VIVVLLVLPPAASSLLAPRPSPLPVLSLGEGEDEDEEEVKALSRPVMDSLRLFPCVCLGDKEEEEEPGDFPSVPAELLRSTMDIAKLPAREKRVEMLLGRFFFFTVRRLNIF